MYSKESEMVLKDHFGSWTKGKRIFDLTLAIILCLILFIPFCLILLMIRLNSKGAAIHWSKRIGQFNQVFLMPKFRTMRIDTPQVATHILTKPEKWVTSSGSFLRRYSLDELPQLISIIKGDMSFVGPRPALFNQDDLMALRTQKGIDELIPGITGWAQVNGRDELLIPEKVTFDEEYLKQRSFLFDIKILLITFCQIFFGKGISH